MMHRSTLQIDGAHPLRIPVRWWLPTGTPTAWLWLQHGFARSADRMADLARHCAEQGFLVAAPSLRSVDPFRRTVQNLGGNTAFLTDIARTLVSGDEIRTSLRECSVDLPERLVFAGHSAGGDATAYLAGEVVRSGHPVPSVVLLDPVRSVSGRNLVDGLARLSPGTVRVISAEPGPCNNRGSGVRAACAALTGFVGVHIVGGHHTDAEGSSTTRSAARMCGAPRPDDVRLLQELTTAWLHDPGAPGPEDPTLQDLVAGGRARLLTGTVS